MAKRWRTEPERHAFYLSKKVDRAVREHNMISDGDRVLVGVSGGKDSLSLLRLLVYNRGRSAARYDLIAAHVKGDARGFEAATPPELAEWVAGEGVELVEREMTAPEHAVLPMDCERCSRGRRRTLFEIADEYGCGKVALGHNLEDFAHTALMNLFQSGRFEPMAFRRDYFGGRFAVIRPLACIRERDLVRFAKVCGFPVTESRCPLALVSRRQKARELMAAVSREFRYASVNVVRAALRLGPDNCGDSER